MLRKETLPQLSSTKFDVAIIGGGITGAGLYLKACEAGLKAVILDKNDFASGTSSRSSKLIHGGLRYLQYLQIKLVYEGLHERENLLERFPHLVKPQPFFMPIYHSTMNRVKFSVGLTGYDMLSGKSSMPKHTAITVEEIHQQFPQVKKEGLKGGFLYFDARTNDARLTTEVIQMGTELGGTAVNYMEVCGFEEQDNKIQKLKCHDVLLDEHYEVSAKLVISATGVWTDDTLQRFRTQQKIYMKPSKGVHILVPGHYLPREAVLILPSAEGDGRFVWSVPWDDNLNVIGTTDTEFMNSPDHLVTEAEEVKYLLSSVNAYLEDGNQLTEDDILSTYAGLRPLLNDEKEDSESTSRSRDYDIWWNNNNFLTIAGGKLTSFLSMADTCLEEARGKMPYLFSDKKAAKIMRLSQKHINHPLYYYFKEKFGPYAPVLVDILNESPGNSERLDPKYIYTITGMRFYIRHQNAVTLDDILTRRTIISFSMQNWDQPLIDRLCGVFAEELGWDKQEIVRQQALYREQWEIMHTWK
jgi:glycerol-3-phosphate dehydrogenase